MILPTPSICCNFMKISQKRGFCRAFVFVTIYDFYLLFMVDLTVFLIFHSFFYPFTLFFYTILQNYSLYKNQYPLYTFFIVAKAQTLCYNKRRSNDHPPFFDAKCSLFPSAGTLHIIPFSHRQKADIVQVPLPVLCRPSPCPPGIGCPPAIFGPRTKPQAAAAFAPGRKPGRREASLTGPFWHIIIRILCNSTSKQK